MGRAESDKQHAQISAKEASDFLIKHGANKEIAQQIFLAIINHGWNALQPETLEGQIIRDADKLDFISIQRWAHILYKKDDTYLDDFVKVLPIVRNKVLTLKASKKLFDQMLPSFKEFIKKHHLERNILLLGFKDGTEKYTIFSQTKIYLNTNLYDAGGMATMEAMSCGLPVVSFDFPSARSMIGDGALWAPYLDTTDYAYKVMTLLSDPGLLELYYDVWWFFKVNRAQFFP